MTENGTAAPTLPAVAPEAKASIAEAVREVVQEKVAKVVQEDARKPERVELTGFGVMAVDAQDQLRAKDLEAVRELERKAKDMIDGSMRQYRAFLTRCADELGVKIGQEDMGQIVREGGKVFLEIQRAAPPPDPRPARAKK